MNRFSHIQADLDFAFFDFPEAFQADPEHAAELFHSLLIDPVNCIARIELLRAMQKQAPSVLLDLKAPALVPKNDFTPEIKCLLETGTVTALRQKLLTAPRLAALACDPDALEDVHQRLMQEIAEIDEIDEIETAAAAMAPASADTVVEGPSPSRPQPPPSDPGLTDIAAKEDFEKLRQILPDYLKALVSFLGIVGIHATALLDFIVDQARNLKGRRFRDALPEWVAEFARRNQRVENVRTVTQEDWQAILMDVAKRKVLGTEQEKEPVWVKEFRDRILRKRQSSWRDILAEDWSRPESPPQAFYIFRRQVAFKVDEEYERAARCFELN